MAQDAPDPASRGAAVTSASEAGQWQAGLDPAHAQIARGRRLLGRVTRFSPRLAGRIALGWFGRVRKFPLPRRERDWLARAEPLAVESAAGRLAGLAWGSGPTVLLAHGWEGRASQMGAIATTLADTGFRAVAIEAPGHGASRGRRSSLLRFAQAIEAAVGAEGPFAGFVGHSFGIAGAAFAVERGELAWRDIGERLVFVSPAADLERFIVAVWDALDLAPVARQEFLARLERHIGGDWERARRGAVLTASDSPLLVLHDHDDRDTPLAEAEEVAAAWPRADLVRTHGLGHRRILRAPEVLEAIVAFLDA